MKKTTATIQSSHALELAWFHRYPARFGTEVVAEMFAIVGEKLGKAPSIVLDPFAGTGTTLAAARQLGIPSVGVELSQLGLLIAQVRLHPPKDVASAVEVANKWANEAIQRTVARLPKELRSWLGIKNSRLLAGYLARLPRVKDQEQRRFLQLAISSALRPSSVWLSGSIKPQVDSDRSPPLLGPQLRRAAGLLGRDCRLESSNVSVSAEIIAGDATKLPLRSESIQAIITSPPYWATYDYFDVQRLSYLAFGWPVRSALQIGRPSGISQDGFGFVTPRGMKRWYAEEYKAETTIDGRSLRAYLDTMRNHFHEARRVLRPGGVAVYAIADSYRSGRIFRLSSALRDLMRESGFSDIETRKRVLPGRRILPAGRDIETGRFTSERGTAIKEKVVVGTRR